jgi:hypothetical protein
VIGIQPYEPSNEASPAEVIPGYEDDSPFKVYDESRTASPPDGQDQDWTEVFPNASKELETDELDDDAGEGVVVDPIDGPPDDNSEEPEDES